jgi:hypothetical protein
MNQVLAAMLFFLLLNSAHANTPPDRQTGLMYATGVSNAFDSLSRLSAGRCTGIPTRPEGVTFVNQQQHVEIT